MRIGLLLVLILGGFSYVALARIGDTLDQLTERYGTSKRLYDKEGGLTIVEYRKEGLDLEFTLFELKTEAVKIHGKLNQKEAEVFMARNVPVGTTFDLVIDPPTPYEAFFKFWKSYSFSDESRAYFYSERDWSDGYGTLVIESAKIRAYKHWKKAEDEKRELAEANKLADKIESKEDRTMPQKTTSSFDPKKLKNPTFTNEGKASDLSLDPPPDLFFDSKNISGNSSRLGQDASFASMATALGRYQHKLYLAIGSRWNLRVQQTMAEIGKDRVVIKFFVNPDGTISNIDVVQGSPNSTLALISSDSIQQCSNLIGAFPDGLAKEKPKGFEWQLAFSIY
jgi:hypothetical protein